MSEQYEVFTVVMQDLMFLIKESVNQSQDDFVLVDGGGRG